MPRPRRAPEPPIVTFRVRLPGRAVARDIEVAANQTLVELGDFIPTAFGFDDPHLWSFFLSGKAWDRASEYALHSEADMMGGPRSRAAGRVQIRDVPFPGATGKKEFLFLFDYGDQWHFGIKLKQLSDRMD